MNNAFALYALQQYCICTRVNTIISCIILTFSRYIILYYLKKMEEELKRATNLTI